MERSRGTKGATNHEGMKNKNVRVDDFVRDESPAVLCQEEGFQDDDMVGGG